ncbi:glycosyltransferase family 39 protein [Candidatus Micrarchaeota archaeon]|nr:glycosyltransferase family 39 protein [Candidatus Micrarchaeota archaeon]
MNNELLIAIFLILIITAFTTPTVPYLRDFDSWYHYRLAEYAFEQGIRPSFDSLSNTGEKIVYPPLLHYLIALPARIPGLNVMLVSQIYPPLAGLLALIFVFLLVQEIFGERTAMLAAILLSVLPVFKAMTSFGFSDHDALDYVFISSAIFFFVKAIKREETAASMQSSSLGGGGLDELPAGKKQAEMHLVYYALAGVSIGLFALAWSGFPMLVILLSGFMLLCALLNSRLKLLDRDMVLGFLLLSVISTGIASLWYGFDILPLLAIELASAAFSYIAVRFEKSDRTTLVLVAIIICSLPLLYLFRGDVINTGFIYLGLRDRGVYLEYVAELKTPDLGQFSQLYGIQLVPFLLGLGLFAASIKQLKRHIVFFAVCTLFFAFLASSAIRFIQYFGIFASIFSAYLLDRLFELISKTVKKDAFIPLMFISALLFTQPMLYILPTMTFSVSDDWYNSLQWLKNNSKPDDIVLSWWDYSQWVNGIAERKTVVNNQPPGRFDDSMIFFGTKDWGRAENILGKYNVSYVIVSRGTLLKIYTAGKFLNETIDFQIAKPTRQGTTLYQFKFSGKFKTYFDPVSRVAWDEDYGTGSKKYYREVGLFDDQLYKTVYFTANITGAEFNDDYLYIFSDNTIRIPKDSKNRIFFNLLYEDSTIPYLELVKDSGEVRIYKVIK